MSDITIKTNGHARELKPFYALPANVQAEFDYMGAPDESNDEHYSSRFFEYRGSWYDSNEFERATGEAFAAWDAWQTESYFSAVLIRYPLEWDGTTVDYDSVVVGYSHW